jgi:hypothetical protein
MAALQERNGSFRILFRFQGKLRTFTLGQVTRQEAEAKAGQVDLLLLRLRQKLIAVPAGVSIEEFPQQDGHVRRPEGVRAAEAVTLAALAEKYLATHSGGAMEVGSLRTVAMHLGHLRGTLGDKFPVQELTLADLQRHVDGRRRKKYRGKSLSPVTLRKEVASFRAAWNWGAPMGLVKGAFPGRGLVYPKGDEKPPFMTWPEVERRVRDTPGAERQGLWDALYLRKEEIADLLAHFKDHATQPWVYPLCRTAAHTGARRSELLRAQVGDASLAQGTLLVREKNRSRRELILPVGLGPTWPTLRRS